MQYLVISDEFGDTGGQLLPTKQAVMVYAFAMLGTCRIECADDLTQVTLSRDAECKVARRP